MGEEPESIFQEWKENIEKLLQNKGSRIDNSECPRCKQQTIKFDKVEARIFCTNCGFTEHLIH